MNGSILITGGPAGSLKISAATRLKLHLSSRTKGKMKLKGIPPKLVILASPAATMSLSAATPLTLYVAAGQ